jgi:hypothetical protein
MVTALVKVAAVFISCAVSAFAQESTPMDSEVSFTRKSSTTYYGIVDGRSEVILARADLDRCQVTQSDDLIVSRERGTLEKGTPEEMDAWLAKPPQVDRSWTTRTLRISKKSGILWPFDRMGWTDDWPIVGTEFFYVPMLDNDQIENVPHAGIVMITLPPGLIERFKGHWAYRINKPTDDRIQVEGPVELVEKDEGIHLAGYYKQTLASKDGSPIKAEAEYVVTFSKDKWKDRVLESVRLAYPNRKLEEPYDDIVGNFKQVMLQNEE